MASPRPKRKKLTLTLKIKNDIIQRIDHGETYSQLSREFGIGCSTICNIYKDRGNILKAIIRSRLAYKSQSKTLGAAEYPELEEKLYQWYLEERNLYPITGDLIILKARTLHKEMTGKDDFTVIPGWLDRFKKSRGIVLGSGFRGGARLSKPADSPASHSPPPPPGPAAPMGEETGVNKFERTAGVNIYKDRGNILKAVIRSQLAYKSQSKTLGAAEYPELEEKLYQWYLEERNLYPITGDLIILKARTLHKEMTGKDDFTVIPGWLDRFKKSRGIVLGSGFRGGARLSKPADSPAPHSPPPPPGPAAPVGEETGVIKFQRTAGDQLVIRVTDELDSNRNGFNRFTINDGDYEYDITIKEEIEERLNQEEESKPVETEVKIKPHDRSEMMPPDETILGM